MSRNRGYLFMFIGYREDKVFPRHTPCYQSFSFAGDGDGFSGRRCPTAVRRVDSRRVESFVLGFWQRYVWRLLG